MSRADKYMPLYWGDYHRDTGHLDAAEHGAYLLLIGHAWTTKKPLPLADDMLRRIARMERSQWDSSRDVVLAFFVRTNDGYVHPRVEKEIERADERYERRLKAGQKGNETRWSGRNATKAESQCDETDVAMRSQPYPYSSKEEKEIEADASISPARERVPDRFPEFWAAYPRKADKRRAEEKWRSAIKRADADTIIRGAVAYAAARAGENPQYTKLPATWLNADAWANEESAHGTRNDHRPANDRPIRNPFVARAFKRYEMGAGGRAGGGVEPPGDGDAEDARGVPIIRAGG